MADGISTSASPGRGKTLDVAEFLKDLPFTRFHVQLLVICSLVTFFDGLDFSLISFTLPYLRDEMGLSDQMTGFVSSAAFLGQMIGSLMGSYIADIIGRRQVIIWCTILSAILTFLTGFANTPEMLIVLRLIGGLAIGGLLAPAWSINIESMPPGKKALSVTIIMLGFSAGGAAAGQVTNWLAPQYGWEGVFFFCGAATAVLAIALLFTMPESARWMTAKRKPASEVIPVLSRFDPSLANAGYTEVILSDERDIGSKVSPWAKSAELFRGTLAFITPLIWFTYFFSSFAIYLKASFGVLFMEQLGIERAMAANLASIGGMIGAIGGVALLWFTEKRGPAWIAIAPLLGIPLALWIGSGILIGGPLFIPVILVGSVMIGAGHAAVISITSIYYPSAVRATGGGWASFMAKFAAVAAPILGGYMFLADKQAVLDGYLFTALCLAGVVIGLLVLSVFARRLLAEQAEEASEAPVEAEPATAGA
ncbi:MFS transporter [Croceibacterium sp. LX-88]|jgi:AAHS family 4-hydroxybenzoate transporter-like MFS transporter|uniref:MFS transporter n=1 Tax=Croceibacterium selenioxidans TaxID=2838833 RepID=A0ABS5W0Y7_9SPHN|nr:MFS transporter [Croceibacterium selenioxidans]MBT2132913.1 MFS transporter [Croceibacterium selenioxidans]